MVANEAASMSEEDCRPLERVSFVSRYERPERGNGSNPHIWAVEVVSAVALIIVALAQLTQIFAAP